MRCTSDKRGSPEQRSDGLKLKPVIVWIHRPHQTSGGWNHHFGRISFPWNVSFWFQRLKIVFWTEDARYCCGERKLFGCRDRVGYNELREGSWDKRLVASTFSSQPWVVRSEHGLEGAEQQVWEHVFWDTVRLSLMFSVGIFGQIVWMISARPVEQDHGHLQGLCCQQCCSASLHTCIKADHRMQAKYISLLQKG